MRFILSLLLMFTFTASAAPGPSKVITVMSEQTSTGLGSIITPWSSKRVIVCYGLTTAGAGAAAVTLYGANDASATYKVALGTITFAALGTTVGSDDIGGFSTDAPWKYLVPNLDSASGTGTKMTCTIAVGAE